MSLTDSASSEVAKAAAVSSRSLAVLSADARNAALTAIHQALAEAKEDILAANATDLHLASKAALNGELSQSVLKRLDLCRKGKWEEMLQGILDVRDLDDPGHPRNLAQRVLWCKASVASYKKVGKVTLRTKLDDGLILERRTCPIGVLLIIFEARPEVIANITSLAIKSGNAAILKGGKESTESFKAISGVVSNALAKTEVPNSSIQLVMTRESIGELLALDKHIDLVIPRGSNELVRSVKSKTSIPVLGHADGLCSIYIHADADSRMSVKIVVDAKLGYTAACNSVETLLVDEKVLETVLPQVASALLEKGVSLRCDVASKSALERHLPKAQAAILQSASDSDFDTEFLDLILAIKTIPSTSSPTASVDLAAAHINSHSSKHTDAIVTSSEAIADRFLDRVDSACVFWNTSTRMADGMRFGFGTEVGISTNKIHARGPVGLEGLMIYKYRIKGVGQVAGDYSNGGGRSWKHEKLM